MKISTKQWTTALESACEGKTQAQLASVAGDFVRLLAKRGELGRVREVIRRLKTIVIAETAHPLNPSAIKAIEDAAEAPVTQIVNPELVGGMRLRVGDRMIDGSVLGQLERLHKTLAG